MTLPLFDELRDTLAGRQRAQLGPAAEGTRPASVLVPFYEQDGQAHLLFLKRPDGHYHHAGQVAFPGGKREGTEDALACALREAREEVGLAPVDVEVLGVLDDFDTIVTRFRVTPVVGVIPCPYPFVPDPREVERLIHVPLSRLLDPSIFREEEREAFGRKWPVYHYAAGTDDIWGVTAGMLKPLLSIVRGLACMREP
jgi:8-oxo-dGTP pyrophosphatase MutT (NUDIX family)